MTTPARDPSLVRIHRGGDLDEHHHRLLATWAAACAERVLPLFAAAAAGDGRPAAAIASARAWAAGACSVGAARTASVAAHAAARSVDGAARCAARACGHAAATAHMADHELGAAYYALLALEADGATPERLDAERLWQWRAIPDPVKELVRSDVTRRSAKFRGVLRQPTNAA